MTRRESVLFLKEFCTFSQTLQPQSRESFFKTLHNLGVLPALEITLASENRQTKSASIDILLFIVDFSPTMVREHMLQQLNNTEDVSQTNELTGSFLACQVGRAPFYLSYNRWLFIPGFCSVVSRNRFVSLPTELLSSILSRPH